MTIVDQIKKIASMTGVAATGSTIYEALDSFEKGLAAKQAAEKKSQFDKRQAPKKANKSEKQSGN